MAVRFVLGRAGTGKTRHCLDTIAGELGRPSEDQPLLLIVPEQASFQMERALAARAARRGYSRAEVLSFSRLSTRVFDQFAGGPAELTPQSRVLALRAAAAAEPESLRTFGPAARTHGFFQRLSRLVEELLRENVSCEALRNAAATLVEDDARERVGAVATLLARYLELLGPERCDPAQRLARLRERLAEATWLRDAAVWIDGFAGFTAQETETLVALAGITRSMEITLLLDPAESLRAGPLLVPDELRLFHRTEQTYGQLRDALTARGSEVRSPIALDPERPPRFRDAAAIAALEQTMVRGVRESREDPPATGVRILACETHRAELRQAARFIRRSILESGGALRFRDFAIIARDLEPFHRLLAETLGLFDIPFFLDRRRSLAGHALVRFVGALLGAARRDAPLPLMIRLLQSELLPLPRNDCERIENLALAIEPIGLSAWRDSEWRRSARGGSTTDHTESRELHAARRRFVEPLVPLAALATHEAAPCGTEWCRTLLATLEAFGVRGRLDEWIRAARTAEQWDVAETHRLAWEAVCGVLDDVASTLGATQLSADDFAAMMESSLAESSLGLAPPTVDQVLVSSIERSRHPEIKHAWLFAFNEGIFPARPGDDAILSEAERTALLATGLRAPSPGRDDAFSERLLAYIAVTRPSRSLTISFARLSTGGDEMFPSPLLADIRRALPGAELETAAVDEPPLTPSEFADAALGCGPAAPRAAALERELRGDPATRDFLVRLLRGREYTNAAPPIARRIAPDQHGFLWYGSPSEIETALQCPFRRFAAHTLRIEEQRGPLPVEWELGSMAHAVIAAVCARGMVEFPGIHSVPDERWADHVRDEFERLAMLEPVRPELAALRAALEPFVAELLLAHAARWRRGGPSNLMAVEERFGETITRDRNPALQIEIPGVGTIGLRGVIDRIDSVTAENRLFLVVYDYKSSAQSLRKPYLTGQRLQVLTYLLAAEQAYAGQGSPVGLAGAFLAPLYPNRDALESERAVSADEAVRRMMLYRPAGVFDQRIARALDESLGLGPSPVANMRLKKDGGFYSNCDARPASEIAARLDLARATIMQTATGIIEGRVDVAPLVEGRRLACGTCAFRAVCRFDTAFNRPRAAERVLPILASSEPDQAETRE